MKLAEANHVLRQTDAQLAQMRQAAGMLPVRSRDALLHAVAHRLSGHNPTNDDVDATIIAVLADADIRVSPQMNQRRRPCRYEIMR